MNVSEFAAGYNKMPHLIGDFPTPKARVVRAVIAEFERTGAHCSPSGATADIVAKWLLWSNQPMALYYHQGYRCWVVARTTDAAIEAASI